MTYADKLKDPRWQKMRLDILSRDNFTCRHCKDASTTLHVHHVYYRSDNPWEAQPHDLVTLCEHCHYLEERAKKKKQAVLHIKKFWNCDDLSIAVIYEDHDNLGMLDILKISKGELILIFSSTQDLVLELFQHFSQTIYSYGEESGIPTVL